MMKIIFGLAGTAGAEVVVNKAKAIAMIPAISTNKIGLSRFMMFDLIS
jgi:hypothetical protein